MSLRFLYSALAICIFAFSAGAKEYHLSQDFGDVPVGTSKSLHWNLRAKNVELPIHSIESQGTGFSKDTDCPEILPAQQKCKAGVIFTPTVTGAYQGRLVIDLYTESFIVDIVGKGIQP